MASKLKAGWVERLTAAGIATRNLGPGHWRTSKGARTVDFWSNTARWRDLGLGVQGDGVRSLIAHYKARP